MKPNSEKSALMKPKMPTFNGFCQFRLCNLILATSLEKKKESLWKCKCQDHGQRPNTQTKDLFVQGRFRSVFQIIHDLNCQKWQTVAARLSVQNVRQDKPQLGAKYSCKTGLFHRFQPGNKISKIWAGAPSLPETRHEGTLCVLPVRWRAVKTLSGKC